MSTEKSLLVIFICGVVLVLQGVLNLSYEDERIMKTERSFAIDGLDSDSRSSIYKETSSSKPLNNIFVDPVQSQRRKNLLKECQLLPGKNYSGTLSEMQMRKHIIYDDKVDLLFCDLPKVGSTFLKQVLHIIYGHKHVHDPFSITGNAAHSIPFKTFQDIHFDEALAVSMRSAKFMFVRHPYTRMLSGYVDKIFTNNFIFWEKTGRIILKNHRKNLSEKSKTCGHDSTFPEFIQHVIESETSGKHRNPHWYPMFDGCRPCRLQYDFIGKIESFKEDLENLLKSQNLQEVVDISKMNQGNEKEAISLTVDRAYDVVVRRPSCMSLPQALERAWKVLQIRGVLSQLADFPYDLIKKKPKITKSDFLNVIANYMKRFPMTQSDKELSKEQAIVMAYESVPLNDLEKFNSIFHPDFTLFGYEKIIGKKHKKFLKWEPFELKL
ncbi:carbohydrate sulfotransferase 14-like [Argopecten irradians]|uniref:carbohydrate sulfotransferase 14-like n=1 Tax=Argopecten irradians TaxID=31199 RepID=UPI0037136D30